MRDRVEIDTANLGGDFVIVRADGTPLYHFTVVVDDAAMEISHVIRGEDHVSNTPKHILLFEALGHAPPVFAHLPLILNPDGSKMSKRKAQTAVADYIAQGFVREALVNYLAFLGWSPGTEEEVLSLAELEQRFELDKVQKGGALFDRERLEWLNGQWIRRLDDDDLVDRLRPFIEAAKAAGQIDRLPSAGELRALLPMVRERLPDPGRRSCDLVGYLWVDALDVDPASIPPTPLGRCHDARRAHGGTRRPRGARRGDLGGGRARATAPPLVERARLEGRRPVHGDPRRDHREGRPRRPCSTRWSRSVGSAPSTAWTPRSTGLGPDATG